MKKADIQIGGLYAAVVAGNETVVRCDQISLSAVTGRQRYSVINLKTGRRTTFATAARFLRPVDRTESNVGRQRRGIFDQIFKHNKPGERPGPGYYGEEADPLRPDNFLPDLPSD